MLPTNPLFLLEDPLLISNNIVYRLQSQDEGEDFFYYGKEFPFSQIGILDDFERLYLEHYSDECEKFKKAFVKEKLQKELQSNRERNAASQAGRVLELIIAEVLPELKNQSLGDSMSRARPLALELGDFTFKDPKIVSRDLVARIKKEVQRQGNGTGLKDIKQPLFIFGGRVYGLEEGYDPEQFIHLKEEFFVPVFLQSLEKLAGDYVKCAEKRLKLESLEQDFSNTREVKELSDTRTRLQKLLDQNKYEKEGIGFLKKNNQYYVYIWTPEFVLVSYHNSKYYHFPNIQLGVSVSEKRGRSTNLNIGRPLIINRVKHPYTDSGSGFKNICMGNYNMTQVQKEGAVDAIITLLSDAKRKIMNTYYRGSSVNPHHPLTNDYFKEYEITLAETRRRNLPISNLSLHERHSGRQRGANHGRRYPR